jgi:hypothetical protein
MTRSARARTVADREVERFGAFEFDREIELGGSLDRKEG